MIEGSTAVIFLLNNENFQWLKTATNPADEKAALSVDELIRTKTFQPLTHNHDNGEPERYQRHNRGFATKVRFVLS